MDDATTHVAEAIAIVQALADRDPSDGEGYACGLCLAPISQPGTEHGEGCLWVRARDWDHAATMDALRLIGDRVRPRTTREGP